MTPSMVKDEFGDVDGIPRPAYEHRLVRDPVTDNFMVMRPDASGRYRYEGWWQVIR